MIGLAAGITRDRVGQDRFCEMFDVAAAFAFPGERAFLRGLS